MYSIFGTLDVDELIWYWHYQKYFFPYLTANPSLQILDAGCGNGLWSFYLARKFHHHQILGIDVRQEAIDLCNQIKHAFSLPNLHFRVLPFDGIDFDKEFDIILSFFSLHYSYETDVEILGRFAKALKPGGRLLITVPVTRVLLESPLINSKDMDSSITNKFGIPVDLDELGRHYSSEELISKLAATGFMPQQVHRLVGRFGQWSKLMYSSASPCVLTKILAWPLATLLGRLDACLPANDGMILLCVSRRRD
jgi:SAM-dependent methyltransferase